MGASWGIERRAPMESRKPIEVDGHLGYIYKQPTSDHWYVDYTSSNGKRYRRSLGTSDEVKAIDKARHIIGRQLCPSFTNRNALAKEAVKKFVEKWSPEVHK